MVQILKFVKFLGKFSFILIILFPVSTFLNRRIVFRPRICRLNIWKVNNDPLDPKKFDKDQLKYILIWSKIDEDIKNCLKDKQITFQENKCTYNNCYVTKDKNLLGGDYRNLDAVLLNGRFISKPKNSTLDLPEKRYSKQFYVFAIKESADNYPICSIKFDNYFNLTWTYRLDSDAVWPYFTIYDKKGGEVGPKEHVNWIAEYDRFDNIEILAKKKFGATWFVSNCYTNSGRESIFTDIQNELERSYELHVEVVGLCGSGECPLEKDKECLEQIRKYYFYFAFENSLSNYYVSEKLLKAVLYDAVPIVYGGADYSSFLPPNSYIDARKLGVKQTAAEIVYLMKNRTAYLEYFRWRNHYQYGPATSSVCNLCELINNKENNVYDDFRHWWNPDYKKACRSRFRLVRSNKRDKNKKNSAGSSNSDVGKGLYKRLLVRQSKTDFLKIKSE